MNVGALMYCVRPNGSRQQRMIRYDTCEDLQQNFNTNKCSTALQCIEARMRETYNTEI